MFDSTLVVVNRLDGWLFRPTQVKLEMLGTFLPNIRLDGVLDVQYRLDKSLRNGLNRGEFHGTILNRGNIGKTAAELVAQWNEEHPDDPVEE